ncbi:MAG: flagellar hook-basal body complex protein [Actinomycetota bacterium]|nr:flagellar hook-basal body complex protein [Actinomycetota bacterium]
MMRGMFSAISGLKSHQVMLDVTANDIANVNTIGYKSARTTFRDSLSQLQRGGDPAGPTAGGTNAAQVGLGVGLGSIDNLMQGGALQTTGNPLDLAIQGEGFFQIKQDPASDVVNYTRAGNFTTNADGDLVTQEGFFVVGEDGNKITIPPGATNVAIGQTGVVSYIPAGGGDRTPAGTLSLATFPNSAGLERVSGNRWAQGANSGAPALGQPGTGNFGGVIGGAIEMSNVDLSTTFTNMITAQRGFQANSRVISTSDEMLQDLVNLKR